MRVRVRFRFNTVSGEVELFQIDDIGAEEADGTEGARSRGAAHDAEHDRISAEIGAVTARRPDVEEVRPVVAGVPFDPTRWSRIRPVSNRSEESEPDVETGELGAQ
ncbi:hypothetical protein [Streptomyces griseus]|uniref:hypothetical protein n=1 Tax=Streptomyces griseus TaxID=1911 RepID=UPI0005668B6E|nr:hypothetical protein [Streptomyces griseus]